MHFEAVQLPNYTRKEELFNAVSHAVGILFGLVTFCLCFTKATNMTGYLGAIIYSLSIIILYTASTVYHALEPSLIKKIMRVVDHAVIYVLISGTSITLMLLAVYPYNKPLAIAMISISLAIDIVGTTLTYIDQERFKTVQMVLYMVLGWMCLILMYPIFKNCENAAKLILFVLLGGIVYTVGTTFLALGKKKKYFHGIFHVFVLAGTLLHFIGIYLYLF